MEEHRLKPMVEGYDQELFNTIYKNVQPLKRKLASGIDARRFGVDYEEILSWFDVKFIFVFNKYCQEKEPGILQAHIINSLSLFKYRIIRESYSNKKAIYREAVIFEEVAGLENAISGDNVQAELIDDRSQLAMGFIREKISDDAFLVMDIQLNPPLYVIEKMKQINKHNLDKIPSTIISEYLGLGDKKKAVDYINELKREVKEVIPIARDHFSMQAHN